MQEQPNTFAQHVEAAWRAGLSIAVYAKTHGLAASTLYRWQQKLRQSQVAAIDAIALTPSPAKPEALEPTEPTEPEPAQGKFIALRIQSA